MRIPGSPFDLEDESFGAGELVTVDGSADELQLLLVDALLDKFLVSLLSPLWGCLVQGKLARTPEARDTRQR